VTFSTGTKPFYVLTADFNGDGKLDLAVADESANTVSILLGNGNGSFQTHVDYATGAAPTWIAAGDFNGDGKIDLVTSNANASTFSLLLGNGDGTFHAHIDTATGTGPLSIVAADLNGDGKLDVITANNGADTVSVFLGNGNGTFQTRSDYATGNGPTGVAVADLNGDGIADVATSNCGTPCTLELIGSNTVSVLLGTGGGALSLNQNYETGDSPNAIIVGDFNNDHKPDLAAGNFNALTVSVLLNTAGTKVALTSSPNPSDHGQPVTFTATVSPIIEGAGTPTGTVAFINGPSILGSAPLVNGVATLQSSTLTVGSHSITAAYNGNVMFNGSTSPTLIQVVLP
jgi:hypothetical protein